jgi:hypothetical protein
MIGRALWDARGSRDIGEADLIEIASSQQAPRGREQPFTAGDTGGTESCFLDSARAHPDPLELRGLESQPFSIP